MKLKLGLVIFFIQAWLLKSEDEFQPPHIIFIYADDLGWNDVSFHGSPEIPTPNIDALALSGVVMNNYYGEWLCTPSRAAFLSGKYPCNVGLQNFLIKAGEDTALPLNVTTLPQHLKRLGYETHMVGKWHLGYPRTEYTPTKRGFDSFFGYLNGFIGYYDYTAYQPVDLPNQPYFYGIDLRNGTKLVKDLRGRYAPYDFSDQAKNVVLNHDTSKPLFLYVAQLPVHVGNQFQRFQAPPEIVSKFKYINDLDRRIHAAVMSTLDDTVGTLFEALHQRDMLKNSIVMFISDNGGETSAGNGASSNYPLRGQKHTYWEGGIRLPAVIWSPLLQLDKPRVSKQLMHATDWLPTFYSAAGGDIADLGPIDGHDMWQAIKKNLPSPRKDLLHNLDFGAGTSSYRMRHLKVVNGTTPEGLSEWYGPTGFESTNLQSSLYDWVFKNGSLVRDILQKSDWWIADKPEEVYKKATVICEEPPPAMAERCNSDVKPCLFNITADPCEYWDLADRYPQVVNAMMYRIQQYQRNAMPPQSKPSDPRGDPLCHDFAYVPWLDPEHRGEKCDYLQQIS